jgi:HEAT repeat protein
MNSVIVACLTLSVFGCDSSGQAIEMNIEQLRAAEAALLKNPQDKEALAFVLNQLNDRRGIYRVNAAAVFEKVGEQVGGSISSEAVPALSNLLDKGDDYDKRAAAGALRSFGSSAAPALPILRKNLVPSDRDVAWFSAGAIGNIGSSAVEAAPDLLDAIKKNVDACEGYFSSFCASFIPALGKIGPPAKSAVPDLEALLNHRDPYVRMRLAVALMRIDPGSNKGLEQLEKLLKDSDAEIRRRSLVALAECGKDAKPAKHLVELAIKDDDSHVRREAADLLELLNKN